MGIFTDLLASNTAIDTVQPIVGRDLHANISLVRQQAQNDVPAPADYAARNEVQSLAVNVSTSGNFTITVPLASGESFTTGSLLFDAAAATVESALDSAATTASIVGWTNGDISVSGGDANTAATVLTYDGASVSSQNHPLATTTDVDLNDGTPGVITNTTEGQPNRNALAALDFYGEISGTPADYRVDGAGSLVAGDPARPNRPSASLVNALIEEASYQEQVDYQAIIDGLV